MEELDAAIALWGGDGGVDHRLAGLSTGGGEDLRSAGVGVDLEEPLRAAPARKRQERRKNLENTRRMEEDSRPRKAARVSKGGDSLSLNRMSSQARVRSPSPTGSPSYPVHFPSPTRSLSVARTSRGGSRRKQRRLTSSVWMNAEPIYHDGFLVKAKCKHCQQLFPASRLSGTSQISRHLKVCKMRPQIHNMVDKIRSSIASPEAQQTLVFKDRNFDHEVSQKELVRMIVLHELPLSLVEFDGFRSFVASLNPTFRMVSREIAQADCIAHYKEHRLVLQNLLKNCSSRVSLTVDMWTSSQNLGYLCLTCHFIDNEWNVQRRIIRFCLMETPHDALTMHDVILESIQDWHIEDKIFSLTLDNTSVNSLFVNFLKETLVKKGLLHCQGKLFHVQCASHVFNMMVQDGLREIDTMVDNIRNSVKYVSSSQSRKEKIEEIIAQVGVSGKYPSLDVATQWNSTFLMLQSVLPFKTAFYALEQQDLNYKYAPTSSEWKRVEDVVDLLKVFYTAIKVISGSKYPTSNHYFHEVWLAKMALDNGARSRNPTIVAMVEKMQDRFDKYWRESYLTNCIPVILDPRYKCDYIEFRLKKAFGSHAEKHLNVVNEAIRDLFDEYSAGIRDSFEHSTQGANGDGHVVAENDPLADWDQHLKAKKVQANNELDIYLKEELFPRQEALDILQWWAIQSPKFPILSRMARDVLAVPASSVASEFAFCTGRRAISDCRSRLSSDTVEALICLQDWLKAASSCHKKNTPARDLDDDDDLWMHP